MTNYERPESWVGSVVESARSDSNPAWRRFVAQQITIDAGYWIPDRAGDSTDPEHFATATAAIAIAAELDPDGVDVLFLQGRHARVLGDHVAAARWFERVEATGDAKFAHARTTMAATALAAGNTRLASALLDRAGDDRCTWILRGHLAGAAGLASATRAALTTSAIGDREAIPWTGAGRAILEEHAAAVAALVEAGTVAAATGARALLEWVTLYRSRMLCELDTAVASSITDVLLTRAAALDPLGGDVACCRVAYEHNFQGAGAVKDLLAVLAVFPDHAEALRWAAEGLGKAGEWIEALALWRRSDGVIAGSPWACLALVNYLIRAAYQHMARGQYGAEVEALLDEAIEREGEHSPWAGPLIGKADLYECRRDHATALAYYDRAIARDPRSVHAWVGRASCLDNLGRTPDARACLDRACTLANSAGDAGEICSLVKQAIALEPTRRAQILEKADLATLRDQLRER